jgi:hypothetical protein
MCRPIDFGATAEASSRAIGGFVGNFELVVPVGRQLLHYFRDNDTPGFPWIGPRLVHEYRAVSVDGNVPIPVSPTGLSLIESNFNRPGNLEMVVRVTPTIGEDGLDFFFFDSAGWHGPFPVIADGEPVTGVTANPAFIQSGSGRQGNFELVVAKGKKLLHYSRDNDAPGFPWHGPVVIHEFKSVSTGDQFPIRESPTGLALLESNFNEPGNLELIVRLSPTLGEDRLVFFFRDATGWHGPSPVLADGIEIDGVTGTPSFIQSEFGRQGNFEMLVPQGRKLVHCFRDNDDPGFPWHGPFVVRDFTSKGLGGQAPIPESPTSVSMIESRFNKPGNLEAVVQLRPTIGEARMVFLFRESSGWRGAFDLVTVDGKPIKTSTAGATG